MKILLILSALVCTSIATRVDCPSEIQNCTCTTSQVTCSLRKYYVMPENLDFDLSMIYFYFDTNLITEIKSTHFVNFINLEYLSLRDCKIETIDENAFRKNLHLITLDMSHNNLTYLPPKLFQHQTRITQLYLGFNQLKRIETQHFTHLETLEVLRLNNNELEHIGKDALVNSHKLYELYLETNKLEIPEKNWLISFNNTAETYSVYLDENPWSCDCRMKEFFMWADDHPWFNKHDRDGISVPRCHKPLSLVGTSLAKIPDVGVLKCVDVNITSEVRYVTVKAGEHVDLPCEATGLPLPKVTLTYMNGRVMNTSQGSTHYHLYEAKLSDSGIYTCNASGLNIKAVSEFKTISIRLTVNRTPGNVVAIVFVTLLFCTAGIVIVVYIYKKKFGQKSQYGKLPNSGSAYYDGSAVAASAQNNADSMRFNNSSASSRVENPYASDDDDTEDDRVEYAKDTEFLV